MVWNKLRLWKELGSRTMGDASYPVPSLFVIIGRNAMDLER